MIAGRSITILIAVIFVLYLVYVIMKHRHEKIKARKHNRSIFRHNRD